MREIKFRVWDKLQKEWLALSSLEGIFAYYECDGDERYALMQYTGLKDKNGKEIYEGDIVRKLYPFKSKEEYAKNPYIYKLVKWYKNQCSFSIGKDNWEVIGNIYENLDLLKEIKWPTLEKMEAL